MGHVWPLRENGDVSVGETHGTAERGEELYATLDSMEREKDGGNALVLVKLGS